MNLAPLLQAHHQDAAAGLTRNLGDGYLVTHNFIYKRLREEAIKAGYTFEANADPSYEAFPLLQLSRILKNRVLPYVDNVTVFENLSPGQIAAISTDDLEGNLKRNFLFHEGAHGVVRALSLKILGPIPSPRQSEQDFLLRILLEESCANTCELLGAMDADDKVHRAFYEINSYICHFEQRVFLKKAFQEIGPLTLIPYLVFCYLNANFLKDRIDDRSFQRGQALWENQKLKTDELKNLRSLGKTAFQLSERFRRQTTGLQLRLEGISTPLEEIVQFDFIDRLLANKKSTDFISAFASLLSKT